MFEQYLEELSKRPKDPETQYYNLDMGTNPMLNPSSLVQQLSNVNDLSNNDIANLIIQYHSSILDKPFIDNNKVITGQAFMDERFISIFAQIIPTINITNDERLNCNRLIYDYMLYKNNNKNNLMVLYNLGRMINSNDISILLALGLPETVAVDLAISRSSTDRDIVAMKRVNLIIMNSSIDIMTEQMIVNIYEKLFNNLTPMFEGIMMDVWSDDDFNDQDQEEIYGRITLAILDILNNAPFQYISSVISSYAQDHNYIYPNDPVRINLRAIAVCDYKRIIDAVDWVEDQLHIIVPTNVI